VEADFALLHLRRVGRYHNPTSFHQSADTRLEDQIQDEDHESEFPYGCKLLNASIQFIGLYLTTLKGGVRRINLQRRLRFFEARACSKPTWLLR
jgi:hypothetical protein